MTDSAATPRKWRAIVKSSVVVEAETEEEAYELVDELVAEDRLFEDDAPSDVTYEGPDDPLEEVEP